MFLSSVKEGMLLILPMDTCLNEICQLLDDFLGGGGDNRKEKKLHNLLTETCFI